MNIGPIIKEAIAAKGTSQKKVAETIGKSTTAMTNIVKNKFSPNKDTLSKISETLNVNINALELLAIETEGLSKEIKKSLIELQGRLRAEIYPVEDGE